MATNIFPGVYVSINDNSFYTEAVPGAIGFMCILARKGEDNRPVLTTSASDLIKRYGEGNPAKYGQGWYVAKQYVDVLNNLWVMRVLPDDATYSTLGLKIVTTTTPSETEGEPDVVAHSIASVEITAPSSLSAIDTILNNETPAADVVFYPIGRGEWYNKLAIKITKATGYSENVYMMDIYELPDDTTIPNLVESFTISFDASAKDSSGESIFVQDVLDMYSSRIRCKISNNIGTTDVAAYDYTAPFNSYVYMTGGTDGTMYTANGYVDWENIQDDLVKAYVGLVEDPTTGELNENITDKEEMDFSVVFDAAYPSVVKDSIVELCETRGSCFAFLDNGDNPSPSTALTKRANTHNYTSYRCALYEPFTKVYDSFTGKYIWMTPVYHVVNAFCKTARDKDIWWSFAGLQRGGCTGIKEFRYKLAGGYKDQYKINELNPIMRFTQGGDIIWGNWTAQSVPSALKNIHVVLCLQYIQRTLEKNLKSYIYEFNDVYTWSVIKNNVTAFLSELQTQRALEYFSVNVEATDYEKRNNKCRVDINLRVTGVIEIINVNLNVE